MDIVESIKSVLSPPHKAGYPFILGGVVVAVLGLIVWHPLAWLGLLFTLFCLYFFRDPERVLPPVADVFVAPADGLVVSVERAVPPGGACNLGPNPLMRVSIFLSVLDVHVNRAPITAGQVKRIAYHPGANSSVLPMTRPPTRTSAMPFCCACRLGRMWWSSRSPD